MTAVGPRHAEFAELPGERELRRRFGDIAELAHRLLAAELPEQGVTTALNEGADPFLLAVAELAVAEIRTAKPHAARVSELAELALRCADLQSDLREHCLKRRQRALAGVSSAVGRMRCMNTADDLVQAVCGEVVRSCGFSRAMLSRVKSHTWMPWMAHFSHREIRESDREWMATTRIPLDAMILERDVLQEHRAAYVADVDTDPRTLKTFIASVGTRSYAVAPIFPTGRVVGFLHADHYPSNRAVDDVDCHVLGEFADAFGRIYERVSLLERLGGQRDRVRDTLRAAETIMDNVARAELELARRADQRSMAGTVAALSLGEEQSNIDELLTPREREVIGLIVGGQSNSAIAERLVISEGTVKSHVKQILRKLGAVNRSEVIARYMGMTGSN